LTEEDWERVRRHPGDAARIAAEARWPVSVQSAILHHRERWSGDGYPDGLKKDAIPLPARILSAADSLDAMTSPRPYRLPMAENEARRELMAESGRRYDPAVIEAILSWTRTPKAWIRPAKPFVTKQLSIWSHPPGPMASPTTKSVDANRRLG
jgi:HD-GYP domain-containing protein (c-di-GMP phosphodiesterase class II)